MYFSRVMLNPMANQQQLAQIVSHDSYREHQALWQLFDSDPDAKRDFLYRKVVEHGRVKYYLLSQRIPVDKSGLWNIDKPKPYNPKLIAGQTLFFMLKANPIISVTDANGKLKRHDIVMHEKKRIDFKMMPKAEQPSLPNLVQGSGIKWLQSRAQSHGFSIESEKVIADGYFQHQSQAKNKKRPIKYSTIDFQGILTVGDPEKFLTTLYSGIGKSKAFGCGLMLIRKI